MAFPFRIGPRGRTELTDRDEHIRDLVEQVLFTRPGERVNRIDFGSGLAELVFAPNNPEMRSAAQLLIQGSLQQWLGDLIEVDAVAIATEEATLLTTVQYTVKRTREQRVVELAHAVGMVSARDGGEP